MSTAALPLPADEPVCIEKLKATLRAKLALAGGYVLLDLADGSYLITRWNLTRPCKDLREVQAVAMQVGA